MSILSGFRKQKRYATDEKGRHQLISTWTHTDTVYDDEGKSLTEIIEDLPAADKKVQQTATDSTNANYEILFSESADNVTKSEEARKSSRLLYNPGTKKLSLAGSKLAVTGSNNGTTEVGGGSMTISRNNNLMEPQLSIYNEHSGGEALLRSNNIQIRDDYTSPTKVMEIQQEDIVLTGGTWDGTNTSLKSAVSASTSDVNVTQTEIATPSSSTNYEILFSGSADAQTHTEGANKSSSLKYDAFDHKIQVSVQNASASMKPSEIQVSNSSGNATQISANNVTTLHQGMSITMSYDDIVTSLGNTWDGSHTSLKAALANAGSGNILSGLSAPTSQQGTNGDLYVRLRALNPYLENFTVDYGSESSRIIDTELITDNLSDCNVYIKQYQEVAGVETLIYEYDDTIDLGNITSIYIRDENNDPLCTLYSMGGAGMPRTLQIQKDNDNDKLVMTVVDAIATADAIDTIYIKDNGSWLIDDGDIPSPTASDVGKVLKATDEGEYGWEDASRTNAVQVPPVIYDNGELKKMSVDKFPGLEKVYLTPTAYSNLSTAQKEDLSKIYYVSDYEFHVDPDHPEVVVRVGNNNDVKWFFSGYTFANHNRYEVPESLRQYQPNNGTGRIRVDSTPYASASSTEPISSNYFVGWSNYDKVNQMRYSSITGSVSILDGTVYAVIDIAGGSGQTNPYSDPFDIPNGFIIYYGNKQYTDFDIPDPLPVVTSADNGKVLKVVSGAWAAGADEGGSEAVYMTLEDYEALTTAEKEDPTKIYFVIDEGTKVSPTLIADDGNVEASSYFNNGSDTRGFPWHAFDGSIDTGSSSKMTSWNPWGSTGTEWISYSFDQMHAFSKVRVCSSMWGNSTFSGKYYVEGSNDGTTWINIILQGEYVNISMTGQPDNSDIDILLDSSKKFSKIRLRIVDDVIEQFGNSKLFAVQEFEIYATDVVSTPKIYYKDVLYNPLVKELPNTVVADAGKALVVNSEGEWDKGNIREVPVIHLGDNEKILTVESGEASWSSPKKVTHLYDEIPISNPLYFLGNIDTSTSPLTIDMTQISANYEELRSTDFEFVFMGGESNLINRPWGYTSIDSAPGTFSYNPSTGELIATLYGGYNSTTSIGIVYKKAIIQLNENAVITGRSETIDCSDVPNADTLTVADFGIVLTNVNEIYTSNPGTLQIAASMSYNQTTKQLSWSVNATSWEHLKASGYVIVGNYGDPEYKLITDFVGATSGSDGYRGYVPSPTSSDKDKFLKGDGTWNPVYRELTQAEYDALPASKNSDGIIYFING